MNRDPMSDVAATALAWNRARLRRLAAEKQLPRDPWALGYSHLSQALSQARQAEARAKAVLRKACTAADPACVVIDVQATVAEPMLLVEVRA